MCGVASVRSGLKHSAPEQRKSFLKNLQDILYKKPSDERVQAWLAQVCDQSIVHPNRIASEMLLIYQNANTRCELIYYCWKCGHDAQHWSCLIREAESPAMFSSRDGKLLKPVPRPNRLSKEALQQHLRDLPDELTSQLLSAWSHGK